MNVYIFKLGMPPSNH